MLGLEIENAAVEIWTITCFLTILFSYLSIFDPYHM